MVACSSPQTYTGLADGAHTFAVVARHPVADADLTPATHAWTVAVPPDTQILDGPANPTTQTTASFGFDAVGMSVVVRFAESAAR